MLKKRLFMFDKESGWSDLPRFSFADSFDGLFDTTMDQLVFHSFLNQLDEFLAHFIAGERVSDWRYE